ncbi:hypothetical protein OUY22_29385 [Nonomuraea sp. MCN248]|uniref:Uncharacterized protein n=1 Tax=Nonomuraea corallina TaxID=2989783 RepID=A0ABT4SJY7_9ACTN|nr:hypothetical protein [Nonomuraea corallina]MDA0637539.1 hypothetical protein [Nonomuraea corallina]
MDYPISLALVDFLPVTAMAIGVVLLIPYARHPAVATGGALIVLGGALKAVWKLIVALDGPDLVWLSESQFFLLGTGYTLMAWALLAIGPGRRPPPWAFAGFALLGAAAAIAVRDTWPMLIVTTVSATLVGIRLLLLARRAGATRAVYLFGFTLFGTYTMGFLGSRPEQTLTLQWIEESLNTLTWSAFALGVWTLARTTVRQEDRRSP